MHVEIVKRQKNNMEGGGETRWKKASSSFFILWTKYTLVTVFWRSWHSTLFWKKRIKQENRIEGLILEAINYYPLCPSLESIPRPRGLKVHAMNYSANSWAPADSRTKSVINHISTPRSSTVLLASSFFFIVSCFKSSWNTVMNQFRNRLAWSDN